MLGLRKLSYFLVGGTMLIFLLSFYFFFSRQLHLTAEVIVENVKKEMSELVYSASRTLHTADNISHYESAFKRLSANNEFIELIQVFKSDQLLLTTNPSKRSFPKYALTFIPKGISSYDILKFNKILSTKIYYFEGLKKNALDVFIYFDHQAVSAYLDNLFLKMIVWMTVLTLAYFFLIALIIKKLIYEPAEILRQYAYYQSTVPKRMRVIEYEYIRSSMVQTFDRLDKEKSELYRIARTDALSGLPNREALHERMEWLISEAERNSKEFALLFLDLDHFKSINDSLGHAIGDAYLKEVALIIKNILRSNDIVARVGGDEFVIVINSYKDMIDLVSVIERIQAELKKSRVIETFPIETSCSIGVSFYPKDGRDEEMLMKQADIAMYQAKNSGRDQYHFFTQEIYEQTQVEIQRSKEIKQGISNHEFELYYQPKVDISSGKIIGCEALVRWNHPKRGLLTPEDFIGLSEKDGHIIDLGRWIYTEAMRQQVAWAKAGHDIVMAINISVKQLFHNNFIQEFESALHQSGADASRIDIEIVESLFLDDKSKSYKLLKQLHDSGILISLDDFGTGYSSLSYLKDFPIDVIKIDKAFIDDFQSSQGAVFLDTIVSMGKNLALTVLCEGIETEAQLAFLEKIHCNQYQGYLFSKPLDAKSFEKLFQKHL